MGGKKASQTEVNDYYMSMHVGVAHHLDAVLGIHYGEKRFWSGYSATNIRLSVSNRGLHGGNKKEGGVAGSIDILLGGPSQVLSNGLAAKLGQVSGAQCPGFRGLTSLFFSGFTTGGFYWSSNTPYLKPVWTTVLRAPKGLSAATALIGPSLASGSFESLTRAMPSYRNWSSVAYGNGIFVAVSMGSTDAATSTDSITWTQRTLPLSGESIAYGNGVFVTIGNGTGTGATSTNGVVWSPITIPFEAVHVTYGNGRFVAVGDGDKCAVSDNGTSWTLNQMPLFDSWVSVTSGGGLHVAIARASNSVAFSSDGELWSYGTLPSNQDWNSVFFGGDYFVAVSKGSVAAKSFNGVNWTATSMPMSLNWKALGYGGGAFIAVAEGTFLGAPTSFSATSQDGSNWSLQNLADEKYWSAVIYAFDYFLVLARPSTVSLTLKLLPPPDYSPSANPAHIIYECLTNTDWGMGESSDLIDVQSFEDCGNTLYDEDFGLSLVWTRQSTVEDFINEIIKHVNGVVFTNPRTGLHTMRLIRGGYETSGLREVNPENSNILKFSRRVWGETTNEIVVTWTNKTNEKEETVSLQDLGNISMQGAVISASRNYYGVRSKELAMQLAARELRVAASPLCTCDIELDRSAWDVLPADVISLTWPEYGISGLPMRVGTVDYGRIGDSKIKVTLVEDIFALPVSYFDAPPTTEWSSDSEPPVPVESQMVFTLPAYYSASLVDNGLSSLEYPNAFAGIFAEAPTAGSYSFELEGQATDSLGQMQWVQKGTMTFTSVGYLAEELSWAAESTIAAFANVSGSGATVAGFGFIGNGYEEFIEIVQFAAFDDATGYTVKRGVLDTTPKTWPPGTRVWFTQSSTESYDRTVLSAGFSPQYRFLTNTSFGQLSTASAPIVGATLTERPHLPIRPADFRVEGIGFGDFDATGLSSVNLTWSNRNRLTEETVVLSWTDANTPGEVGQTTRLVIMSGGDLIAQIGMLGLSSHTLNLAPYFDYENITIKAYAEREDFLSLQAHEIRLINVGNVRSTDVGDIRVTDTGDYRYSVIQ